ncbi:hypothetical protein ASD91_04535 [Pseudomonas sp. Root68]|jgi:hypothetical protein|uniref:DUF262 domain-containing protein n=1 Tax=unclassified Pseudomonas TaxID=196821 RepID=UPI0006F7DEF0|nr:MULTISPECIES: DUF262 domain-containing protein [unclassified Pseudomonas]KRB05984.1 hypothetical protein ASD91_04535 [Pseudomonas sp. Root68]KRB68725.1 hypothetical protein ASD95_05780 [Pseudomonas sp. Root71]
MDRVDYQALIIQDIINLESRGELNLTPWYQRRSVWSTPQKSYLVNTLLEQKPIPAIYVRHYLDLENSKSIKEIVDGQQRTRAILSYCKNEFTARHPNYNRKLLYSQLKREEQQTLLLTSIPVGYLLGATDADVIDIFGRINSISKTLNPQEKRNAAYSGEMKQFCLAQASSRTPFWRQYEIFSATDISRMSEVLFISDLVYNLMNGLSDYSPTSLNNMYTEYDEEFDDRDEIATKLDRVFDLIGALNPEKITDTIFNRQPIFFSLVLVLHEIPRISQKRLSTIIDDIDERFHSEENRSPADDIFKEACSSTTQRITQRRIRHDYIKSFF